MKTATVIHRNPVRTLCQIPLALRDMLRRAQAREARRRANRRYFEQFFGLEPKTRSGRLGVGEFVESNLPLSR